MNFLCYVELLGSFDKSHYEFWGQMGYIKTLNHPIHPTPPIAKFQLSILLSERLHTRILAKWVSRFPVGASNEEKDVFLYILG